MRMFQSNCQRTAVSGPASVLLQTFTLAVDASESRNARRDCGIASHKPMQVFVVLGI